MKLARQIINHGPAVCKEKPYASIASAARLGDNFGFFTVFAGRVNDQNFEFMTQEFALVMVFPNIEKIKQEYTDKYVMVDPQRPELARFADVVGQVKTVNMSGRALVEFLDYHLNIGWFDIELEFLKVVDKPLPKEKTEKPVPKKPQDKPEGKAAPTTSDKQIADAKATPGVAPTSKEGKPSTADILAKLKGGAGAAPAAPAAKKEEKPKAEAPAAKAASPGKVDRAKMSVADMLAAARGGAAPAAKSEPPAEEAAPAPAPPAAEAASPTPTPAPEPKAEGGVVKIDKSGMSIEQMLAYCREKDAS